MNLEQASIFTQLRSTPAVGPKPQVTNGLKLARDLFAEAEQRGQPFLHHTPETWVRKWLASRGFRLMRVPLNAVALPCQPKGAELVLTKIHAADVRPILVDYNKNKVGKSLNGFWPQVIVLDGKHRYKAARLRGDTAIWAWVGERAEPIVRADGATVPGEQKKDFSIYSLSDKVGSMRQEEAAVVFAAATPDFKNQYFMAGGGLKIDKLVTDYKAATKNGWKPRKEMEGVTPPGMEDVVKGLKKAKGVDNPWAVAWYLYNKKEG